MFPSWNINKNNTPIGATKKNKMNSNQSSQSARRGKSVLEQAAKSQQQQFSRQRMPFRFFLAKGGEAKIVILDYAFATDDGNGNGLVIKEHNLKKPDGTFGNFQPCTSERGHCDICETYKKEFAPYYAVVMSIIDWRPYTNKNGETVQGSKKLLVIKMWQRDKWYELQEVAFAQNGKRGMRGMVLRMKRSEDAKSSSIGEPVAFTSPASLAGRMCGFLSEEALMKKFGGQDIIGRDGKVYQKAGDGIKPFNYEELFPEPEPINEFSNSNSRSSGDADFGDDDDFGQDLQGGDNASEDFDPDDFRPAAGQDGDGEDCLNADVDFAGDEDFSQEPPARTRGRRVPDPEEPGNQPQTGDDFDDDDIPM